MSTLSIFKIGYFLVRDTSGKDVTLTTANGLAGAFSWKQPITFTNSVTLPQCTDQSSKSDTTANSRYEI